MFRKYMLSMCMVLYSVGTVFGAADSSAPQATHTIVCLPGEVFGDCAGESYAHQGTLLALLRQALLSTTVFVMRELPRNVLVFSKCFPADDLSCVVVRSNSDREHIKGLLKKECTILAWDTDQEVIQELFTQAQRSMYVDENFNISKLGSAELELYIATVKKGKAFNKRFAPKKRDQRALESYVKENYSQQLLLQDPMSAGRERLL